MNRSSYTIYPGVLSVGDAIVKLHTLRNTVILSDHVRMGGGVIRAIHRFKGLNLFRADGSAFFRSIETPAVWYGMSPAAKNPGLGGSTSLSEGEMESIRAKLAE